MKHLMRSIGLAAVLVAASAVVVKKGPVADVPFLGSLSRETIGIGPVDKERDEPSEQYAFTVAHDKQVQYDLPPMPTVNHAVEEPPLHPDAEGLALGESEDPHGHETPHEHEEHHHAHEGHEHGHEGHEHGHHAHGGHADAGHIGHGHHGEGHGEHHHHEESDPEAFGLACFLMGGVACVMMVFYLVNNKHVDSNGNFTVQGATWKVLNMTVSIFVAVLIYGSLKTFWTHALEPTGLGEVALLLILFLVFYLLMHWCLFKVKMRAEGEDEDVEGLAVLMAHVTGFAAMYGFADMAELPFFEELGGWGPPCIIILAAAFLGLMNVISDTVMERLASADGEIDPDEWKWIELCDETDDDVTCLTMSFAVTLFIRYLIRGTLHPYEPGHAGDVTQLDANILYLVAICFVALVIVGTVIHNMIHKKFNEAHPAENEHFRVMYPKTHRLLNLIQHINFMVCAWVFLFWAEWQLYVLGWESTIIGGCLVVAVAMSLASFGALLVMYYFIVPRIPKGYGIRKALRSFELSLGILVGFSWERAFDVGFEELEIKFENIEGDNEVLAAVFFYALNICLFFIVAPAWRFYIFPTAAKFDEKEKKHANEKYGGTSEELKANRKITNEPATSW